MTTTPSRDATDAPPGLAQRCRPLLDAVTRDPGGPLAVAVPAPGGYGKSALLRELARTCRRAGVVVRDGRADLTDPDPGEVLLVDDAHRLDDGQLGRLCQLVAARRVRLVLTCRPWPASAALTELTGLLRRDGQPLLLAPFSRDQTAACLARLPRTDHRNPLVDLVHGQTGGVPRDVERLVRALADRSAPAARTGVVPAELPRSAVAAFAPDLDELPPEVRRLLLAVATGLPLPADLLGRLLDRTPEAVGELLAAARAAGLLGADDRLTPIVRRAVLTLTPGTCRQSVWQRLTALQLARNAPVLPLVRAAGLDAGAGGGLDAGLGGVPAETFEAAAEEALAEEPALAAEFFAASAATGRPVAVRQARAAALAGDLDSALRLTDQLLADLPADGDDGDGDGVATEAATVAATALAHRGLLDRSSELYEWSGTAPASAFAAIGAAGAGSAERLDRLTDHGGSGPARTPPTLLASAATLMARGVRESLTGAPVTALSTLVRASALLEPAGRTALLPDSPAALAALVALHCGELDVGERALDRAVAAGLGGPLMSRRHRLLRAWFRMARGRTVAAGELLAEVTGSAGSSAGPTDPRRSPADVTGAGGPLEPRDRLFASALELGVARRDSDLPALHRGWGAALEAVIRHPVDLFTLLPLGELSVVAARLGEWGRLAPYLAEAHALLDRLGRPPLWATPLHWNGLHAAILAKQPAAVEESVAALAGAAGHNRYATALAAAAESWVAVLRGVVDPLPVEAAARGLHEIGLSWDGARLAGQAAIRTSNRRAMAALLDCARVLQGRPAAAGRVPTGAGGRSAAGDPDSDAGQLSGREREVAELVLAGLTYKQIGDRLFISAKTVEHHVARMRSRLNCGSRSELLTRLRAITGEPA